MPVHFPYLRIPGSKSSNKIFLIMKLMFMLLIAATLQVSAEGYTQTVTLSMKDAPLQKVFKEINKQTGFTFFYSDAVMDQAGRINIEVRRASIDAALQICFRNNSLDYSIVDKTIIIKQKQKSVETKQIYERAIFVETPPVAQQITGKVTDTRGNPLSNVSVTLKGTAIGSTTNKEGMFSLEVPDNNALLGFFLRRI